MSSPSHPLDDDYQYTEDQINPSVKIHAVSRNRSFFSTADYLLLIFFGIVSALVYHVRIYQTLALECCLPLLTAHPEHFK